jgi:hypothetical protein
MKEFIRPNDSPAYDIRVLYDGDSEVSSIHLPGKVGQPPYVVLFDLDTKFAKGDVIAAKLCVPSGKKVEVYDQPISYYTRMLPILAGFETHLKKKGHADAKLSVGEDVGQLDMVACASPHWAMNGSEGRRKASIWSSTTAFTRTHGR